MDLRFAAYNSHHQSPKDFRRLDHHLRLLQSQPYVYEHPLIAQLPRTIPGIYTVGGGRQIGKTTLLKQWMLTLLTAGVTPQAIVFLTGELIDDHHQLVSLLQELALARSELALWYLIIDEITYVKHWDRGIKFSADSGLLHNCVLVLTSSDLTLMQAARMTFPGRRGQADQVDFHLYPLSFAQYLQLKNSIADLDKLVIQEEYDQDFLAKLFTEFNGYLQHGGYLTAINDMAREGQIKPATLATYSDWIRGDILKRGKQELYLKELLQAIIKRYNKQVTWHALADTLSIDSHKTVSEYCQLLSTMDALFIQSAVIEHKLAPAPKKARKLSFTDPFIYHAISYWLAPDKDPNQAINEAVADPIVSADLVEAVVSNHFRRFYPTYYIKGKQEIDVAYVFADKLWPIEIKWRQQLRPKELAHLAAYQNCQLFIKGYQRTNLNGVALWPLPLALLQAPFL